jgi:hypothetical protein
MAFKLKDLMVDLLPGTGAAGQQPPAGCPPGSIGHCPLPSVTQHCPLPSVVHCGVSAQFCAAPSLAAPLCPFPSVNTQCPFPSIKQDAAACPSPSVLSPNALAPAGGCPSPSIKNQDAMAQLACPFPSLTNTGPGPVNAQQLTDLATLKEQLRQQLALVEQHEQAVHAAAKPQTVEDAQSLLQKMQEATVELQAHIDELKKNS